MKLLYSLLYILIFYSSSSSALSIDGSCTSNSIYINPLYKSSYGCVSDSYLNNTVYCDLPLIPNDGSTGIYFTGLYTSDSCPVGEKRYSNYYLVYEEKCPIGTVEINGVCVLPCDDIVPDGYISYPKTENDECGLPYVFPLTEQYSSGGVPICDGCFAPEYTSITCIAPSLFDELTKTCKSPTEPNSDFDNDGITNLNDNDIDGDGVPDELDNYIGYGTIDSNGVVQAPYETLNCDDLLKDFLLTCDITQNEPIFQCDDNLDKGFPYVISSSCVPNKPTELRLCEDDFKLYESICDYGIQGSCTDNGVMFTQNTLECKPAPDPSLQCDTNWHEIWNGTTCECAEGYSYNSFNDCWLDSPDANLTPEDEFKLLLDQKAFNDSKIAEETATADSESESFNTDLDKTRNETLSGIRADNNLTNALLSSINNKLDDNSTSSGLLQSILDVLDGSNADSGLLDYLSDSINEILNKYSISLTPICDTVTPVMLYFNGTTTALFSQETLDKLPMSAIRSMIIFMFTISALSLVFRNN